MSSELLTALRLLILNDYASTIVMTVATYDYILTFSGEVEYIWQRPRTWVSVVFFLVRYVGLCSVISISLFGSTFFPGPLLSQTTDIRDCDTESTYLKGEAVYLVSIWTYAVFLFGTDLMMILRVYAMWSQSRIVLWSLLFVYAVEIVTTVVLSGIYENPNTHSSVVLAQILSFTLCTQTLIDTPSATNTIVVIPRLVLAAMLVFLAVVQNLKQSIQMYKITKQWQPNHYMQLLVRDGIVYFLVNVLTQTTALLAQASGVLNNITIIFMLVCAYATFFPLAPRFIIGIRELYSQDARGRIHIDTGFGTRSQLNRTVESGLTTMVFTDGNRGQQQGDDEAELGNTPDIEMAYLRK